MSTTLTKERRRYCWVEDESAPSGRRRVLVHRTPDGEEGYIARWTEACSGCFEAGDYNGLAQNYAFDEKAGCRVGIGCDECGYTGKRRSEWFIPFSQFPPLPGGRHA